MKNLKYKKDIRISKERLLFVLIIFSIVLTALITRLYYISVVEGKNLKEMAEKQQTNETLISPKRGEILDRNYNKLVMNEQVKRIDIDMKLLNSYLKIKKLGISDVEKELSGALGMKADDIDKIMKSKGTYKTLERGVENDKADKVSKLKISGITISPDTKRYYVNGDFLSQVLGHTDIDGKGMSGVELSYNKILTGVPGTNISEVDNKDYTQLPYDNPTYVKPVNGKDVVLTIDAGLQQFAEQVAGSALSQYGAKSVTIMIMNPKNGEILAMASKPDYDPNSPWSGSNDSNAVLDSWKNRSVQWAFEPGSIFKAVTSEIALETKTCSGNDTFLCNGEINIGGSPIYNWDKLDHGMMSFVDILKNSNNVGFAQIGTKIGKDKLYSYIKKFGFGTKTGIDIPGESPGIVKNVKNVGPVDLADTAFGQGIAVTQVQYMSVFNAIANSGTWIQPHVMEEIGETGRNGEFKVDSKYDSKNSKNIMDKTVTSTLRGYLSKVVSEGVGKAAEIPGYDIAGKTGTAQKADPKTGGYETGKYVSSFAGMVPYEDPKLTYIVSVDEPNEQNYYAAQTAAPAAKELIQDIINYTNILDKVSNN